MDVTSRDELPRALERVPGWTIQGDALVQIFRFPDFLQAMRFVNHAAALAEEMGHHPDLDIRYNRVRVALTTHDAGGITTLDFELASRLSAFE